MKTSEGFTPVILSILKAEHVSTDYKVDTDPILLILRCRQKFITLRVISKKQP